MKSFNAARRAQFTLYDEYTISANLRNFYIMAHYRVIQISNVNKF